MDESNDETLLPISQELPVIEVNSLSEHINTTNESSEVIDGAMSDDTIPATDLSQSIGELDSSIKNNGLDEPEKKRSRPKRVASRRKRDTIALPEAKSVPKRSKPGPKSSKKVVAKSERQHSTTIALGPYRRIKVSIEISGVDGGFSRVDGQVVFTVPRSEDGRASRCEWKLAEILRAVESVSSPETSHEQVDPFLPLLNHDDDLSSGEDPRPERKPSRTGSYPCPACSTDFKRKSDLTVHQRNRLCPALSGPFHCDQCGLTLDTNAQMKKHRKTHNRALCHLCGKTFPVGHCMKQHMITHAGYKPFDCQYCGAQFRSKTACSLHESTHKDDRPHICQMCAASFKRIGLLKRHIKFVHNQEAKDVRCKTCGRGFRSKSDLNAHLPSHTGEKKFCCDQCGKRFAYKVCLSDHVKTVHSDVRAYKCGECDKAFKTSSMLASHRRSHTKQATTFSQTSKPQTAKLQTQPEPLNTDYVNQRPLPLPNNSDFPQYTQRYIPQVGDYNMSQNVFSPLRYLELAPQGQGQKQTMGYRDSDDNQGDFVDRI